MLAVVILSVVLAMDAAAVTAGLAVARQGTWSLVWASVVFGLFQAGMAGGGAWGGAWLALHAGHLDHWIAFGLLTAAGGRMVWGTDDVAEAEAVSRLDAVTLITLAVATSIDALAAGVTLPLMGPGVWVSLGCIGVVTTVLSGLAAWLGRRAGDALGPAAARFGGLVLIGLGVKILVEHLAV